MKLRAKRITNNDKADLVVKDVFNVEHVIFPGDTKVVLVFEKK